MGQESGRTLTRPPMRADGESRGGISPPRAPRTVREPLDSNGSRCSAIGTHVQWPCLVPGLLLLPVGSGPRLNNAAPSVQSHYRTFNPTTGCSAPVLRIGTPVLAVVAACDRSLGIGTTGSHVPYKSLAQLRAAYMPDATRAAFRQPPNSSRRKGHPPVLTSSNPLSTLHRRFACARLSGPYLPGSWSRRFCNAHHHRSLRQQLAVV